MEIATMPYVADSAPPAGPKVQGKGSGGNGKPADSFAGLMAGKMSEGKGDATKAAAPDPKAVDPETKDSATPDASTAAEQVPWNLLALAVIQALPAGGQTAGAGDGKAAVTAVQATTAAGAGASVLPAAMPAAGGQPQGPPQARSGSAGFVAPTPAVDGQASREKAATVAAATAKTPTAAAATATIVPADTQAPTPTPLPPAAVGQTAQAPQPPLGTQAPPAQSTAAPPPQPAINPQTAATTAQATATDASLSTVQTAADTQAPVPAISPAAAKAQAAATTSQVTAKPAPAEQPAAKESTETAPAPPAAAPLPASAGTTAKSGDGNGLNAQSSSQSQDQAPAAAGDQQANVPAFTVVLDHRLSTAPPAAPAASPAPQTTPADPYNVAGQIVDQARLTTAGPTSTEMVIKLKPEHLGEVTMKITVESGVVSATFHAANPEVRGAIESTLTQLRQDMANQGLKVDYVGVYASLDQFFQGGQQQQAPQQPQLKTAARRKDDDSFPAEVAAVAAQSQLTGGSGIDYRI